MRPENPEAVLNLDANSALKDNQTLRKVLIVLLATITLFVFQREIDLSSGFIALAGASLALVWVRPNIHEVMQRIDFGVLLFSLASSCSWEGLKPPEYLNR